MMMNKVKFLPLSVLHIYTFSRKASSKSVKLLDPKYDKPFKHVFGNQLNSCITQKFIYDVTGRKVEEITFVDPYLYTDITAQSKGILDILCKSPEGEWFLIEIQKAKQSYFGRRILYYGSSVFSNQVKVKEICEAKYNYAAVLKDVVVISVAEKSLHLPNKDVISHHLVLDTKTHTNDIPGLEFFLVDLTKFNIDIEGWKDLGSAVDVWCFYLKYIHHLDEHALEGFTKLYPWVQNAVEVLRKFQLPPDEYEKYLVSNLEMSIDESAVFIEEERRQAARVVAREIAKNLLRSGISVDDICQATGLKENEFK